MAPISAEGSAGQTRLAVHPFHLALALVLCKSKPQELSFEGTRDPNSISTMADSGTHQHTSTNLDLRSILRRSSTIAHRMKLQNWQRTGKANMNALMLSSRYRSATSQDSKRALMSSSRSERKLRKSSKRRNGQVRVKLSTSARRRSPEQIEKIV